MTVEFLGQSFSFKADENVTDAKAVADYVAKTIDEASAEFSKKMQPMDKRGILILAALNIANEYIELKEKHQHLLNKVGNHSANMLNKLDIKDI